MRNFTRLSFVFLLFLWQFSIAIAEETLFVDDFDDGDYTQSYSWIESNNDDYPGYIYAQDGAVRFYRTGAGGNGGSVGIYVDVDIPVNSSTNVKFDGKVVSRTVGAGCGWTCGEYPVIIRLYLEDNNSQEVSLKYALNYGGDVQDKDTDTLKQRAISVEQNTWIRDVSFNINEIWPNAKKITKVFLYGSGWDFDGHIDNIRILGANTGNKPQISIVGGFIKLDTTNGNEPSASDCSNDEHDGRMVFDDVNGILHICSDAGWKSFQ